MTNKEMHEYGYMWDGMIPVSAVRAKILMGRHTIFRLYPDNTEAEVANIYDIDENDGFLYGIERPKKEIEIINIAKERLREMQKKVESETSTGKVTPVSGLALGEYNTWMQILNILEIDY